MKHLKTIPRPQTPKPAEDPNDFTLVLKTHHRVAGLTLKRINDKDMILFDGWGGIVETFSANYLSPQAIWRAADREIARGVPLV